MHAAQGSENTPPACLCCNHCSTGVAMQVPGRSGFTLLGDESIEFARTPRDYVEKRRENYGDVFLGRVLNKPTVFFTSNSAVQDLLKGMGDLRPVK